MFGKLRKAAKKTANWFGKAAKSVYNTADQASNWFGKQLNNVKQVFNDTRDIVRIGSREIDDALGLDGTLSGLEQSAENLIGSNPYVQEGMTLFNKADDLNSKAREKVFDNSKLHDVFRHRKSHSEHSFQPRSSKALEVFNPSFQTFGMI